MAPGLFAQAQEAGTTQTVSMGQAGFLPFHNSEITNTGTAALGGCFAVAIVSPRAVILAHIPPDDLLVTEDDSPDSPDSPDDPYAGFQAVYCGMDAVRILFTEFCNYFHGPGVRTLVVCGLRDGVVAFPQLRELIEQSLVDLGLGVDHTIGYDIPEEETDPESCEGTVFINGEEDVPELYVEDYVV